LAPIDVEGTLLDAVTDGVTQRIGLAQNTGRGDIKKTRQNGERSEWNKPIGQFLSGEEHSILHMTIIIK
jgi:hypothetical protein